MDHLEEEAPPADMGEGAEPKLHVAGLPQGPESLSALAPREKSTQLAPADPLTVYMREVMRHPLLEREEELALAREFQKTGDPRLAWKLVAANLRLVVKLAYEYHRSPLMLLDIIQEGNMGLIQAVKKFDPERGVRLSSYAAWWIRAYVLRYIMDSWKLVKIGTTEAQRKLFFKLRQEQEKLAAQGFEVTPKLLAERLNVTEEEVEEMDLRLGQDELSLDAPLGDEEDGRMRSTTLLASPHALSDELLAQEQLSNLFKGKLRAFAKTLKDKEKYVFEKRLVADEPMTLQEIGTHFSISRERARQIEAALIEKIRKYMRAEIPDFDLVAINPPEAEG
ncbi:MAG: RNA polymerase factor sigma-32 [Cystobacterineae bacterium]|nr:RNA polymerase factor sigma-32 [Cystobacterineae bacterium]